MLVTAVTILGAIFGGVAGAVLSYPHSPARHGIPGLIIGGLAAFAAVSHYQNGKDLANAESVLTIPAERTGRLRACLDEAPASGTITIRQEKGGAISCNYAYDLK